MHSPEDRKKWGDECFDVRWNDGLGSVERHNYLRGDEILVANAT